MKNKYNIYIFIFILFSILPTILVLLLATYSSNFYDTLHRVVGVVLEFIIVYGIAIILVSKHSIKNFIIFIFISLIYLIIMLVQCFAMKYTGKYISYLAIININNISMEMKPLHSIIIAVIFITIVVASKVIFKLSYRTKNIRNMGIILILIGISYLILLNVTTNKSFANINDEYDNYSPSIALFNIAYNIVKSNFTTDYKSENVKNTFIKDAVYINDIPTSKDIKNIIILIPDGVPARLIKGYRELWGINDDALPNLTPNIDSFMKKSLVIDNFYNHTAATYPAISGIFTSTYPYNSMVFFELLNMKTYKRPIPILSSLFDIMHLNGYKSYFIDANNSNALLSYMAENVLRVQNVYNDFNNGIMVFESIKRILADNNDKKIIVAYFLDTHYNFDGQIKYGDGQHLLLNALHSYDMVFGDFFDWYSKSDYAKNSLLIFTTDHTAYPDNQLKSLIENNNVSLQKDSFTYEFTDKIPFIIYGYNSLGSYYDAKSKTTLDFVPTILSILGYKKYRNTFMGNSIFDEIDDLSMFSNSDLGYCIKSNVLYRHSNCLQFKDFNIKFDKINEYRYLEKTNSVFDGIYLP